MSWVAIGVGVVGAAGTAYSASQSGGSAPAPVQANPGQSLMQYIKGLGKGLPSLTNLESQYRPQYGELNIADQQQYLNALLGMSGQATTAGGAQLQSARQEDIANMQLNAGGVNSLLGMIDPQGRAMADRATTMANDAYNRAQGPMSFQDTRGVQQAAREAAGSRGRINDNVGIAAEVLGREEFKAGQRQEAQDLSNNAFALNQQFSSPALGMLMGTPASLAYGQDLLGRSQGIIGQNTPQLINPDAGINMGMQNASNLNAYNMAQASARQNSAAQWGQMGTSLLGLAGDIYTSR